MAPQTSAKTFGISCHLTASQACHAQEVQSSNPCMELNCYLSDPLEQPGIAQDILSIPASSVPCKREFSGAKHTDTNNQNHLLLEHLGAIQIATADMLHKRRLQKEGKTVVDCEKLQQWHEHELGAGV